MKKSSTLEFVPPPGAESAEVSAVGRHFARFMVELNGRPSTELEFSARLVSAWREAGHICVPLRTTGLRALAVKLREARVVGRPGEMKPLILDDRDRLYLQRYWHYENELARAITERLRPAEGVDASLLARGLQRFFGSDEQANEQQRAAATAVEKNFCVISGGPGTGKTRTVVVILALLVEQFSARGRKARIALAASTGKAAARMKESVERTAAELEIEPGVRAAIPSDAKTLHRLLGPISESPYFRHDAERPLAVDAVIVDEASMVDLALMTKLVAAVPTAARLILLGDKDQLASVEAGYVLGDICQVTSDSARHPPISQHIVELKRNYRFGSESGINRLSALVNAGEADAVLGILRDTRYADIRGVTLPAPGALAARLRECVMGPEESAGNISAGYRAYRQTDDPREALMRFAAFRILAAVRRGPFGVINLNSLAQEALAAEGLIRPETGLFYAGRPVLVLRNDPQLKLFNGDVGLILPDPEADGALRAFFMDAGGLLRRVLPARLPEHETVFAMTVHKSQGSEFERVLLVLPDRESQVVTRELVYTGMTRARKEVELWYREQPLRAALMRRIERSSGLHEALWGQ